MIKGKRVNLRRIVGDDWPVIEAWLEDREASWGPYQRFQLDAIHALREAFERTGLLGPESGMLMVETADTGEPVGFVRYTLLALIEQDMPSPEIGFVIADRSARGKGYGKEATALLIEYVQQRFPSERVTAFTDIENIPAQRLLESLGFMREGTLRHAFFRNGIWSDVIIYGLLRDEWKA